MRIFISEWKTDGKLFVVSIILASMFHVSGSIQFYFPPTSADCRNMTPFKDMQDCTSYYQCFRTGPTWTLIHSMCPPGGIWNDEYKACVEGTCGGATTTSKRPKPTKRTTISTKKPVRPSARPQPSPKPRTTTKRPITSKKPSNKPIFVCRSNGTFAHPNDRNKYYICHRFGRYFYYYTYSCPPFSCFQTKTNTCAIKC